MNRGFSYAAAIALTICLSGCSAFDGDDDDRRPVTDNSMYGGVPTTGMRAVSGFDTIRYRASETGSIWVGNDNRRSVVVQHRVNQGDEVVVEPGNDRVTVNGQTIYSQNLEKNEQHSIFFAPNRAGN